MNATRDDLWRLAERCPAEALGWLSLGWRLGILDGRDEGWDAAQHDMAMRWHRVYLDVQAMARQPTFAELQRRRGEAA